ncbi:MAG: type II secretion system protein [Gallionella sp.]|nr:MAG: type II secretion system protein [Gallionella sp.]
MYTSNRQRGVSLVELVMFIVIVSVALAAILLVMNTATRGSADPLVRKQALAIAESLLEEVELMPFTICDPDDGMAASAYLPSDCGTVAPVVGAEGMGAEAGETRYSATAPFDNVNDYNGFAMNAGTGGIVDISGTPISAALDGYSAIVTVVAQALGGIAAADSLLIIVSVTGPDGVPVVVDGMRTRHAPRTLP